MQKLMNAFLLAGALTATAAAWQPANAQGKGRAKADDMGWKLGAQAYTFNRFTLAQTLDKLDSCGLQYVECYPGQKIGGGIEGTTDFKMDAATRDQVKALLKKKHKTLVAYGVVSPNNETEWQQVFDFAKDMGILVITAEPKNEHWDLISKLCDKYQIKVAIHDHPRPSHYWHPDSVLTAIKGRSPLFGACADIGHWVRSGLDPVECIRKLQGHVMSLHIKDMNEKSPEAHDVVWGNGVSNIPGVLKELKRQHFKGPFSAEYEYHWDNSVPDVKASAAFWWDQVSKL
ncbi:sugar phosphate isomerase/epimerase [Chitinophaga agrisoli]|uniref:Sugar phosphate isomerase/epimerase n=1 Tax=Chitinophaga agrisoli TaxID=2607653 RepID=A0A5B2VJM2_9BACT|nr:sugar phosphate isomerase/epimerase [Chitinophaga agrisoli]KAA2239125.1 sugar phosphate isomerase/epimerase [Chitinophaga agrisoli]